MATPLGYGYAWPRRIQAWFYEVETVFALSLSLSSRDKA